MRLAPLVLLLTACPPKDTDTDTDTGTDVGTDTDIGTDTDTDLANLESIEISASSASVSTRQTVEFTVTGTFDDSSTEDVTSSAALSSDDTAVLTFFAEPVGQPLRAGTAVVTATVGGLTDSISVDVSVAAPQAGDITFNEILADGTVEGDPNGDTTTSTTWEDEFVELSNASGVTVDLSGATLVENDFPFSPRHTFAPDTVLLPGSAVVVFGGGDASTLTAVHAWFDTADNNDSGNQFGLALTDAGDTVKLVGRDGTTVLATASWSAAPSTDTSIVLQPEITGTAYSNHTTVGTADYSPGAMADGAAFGGPDAVFGSR